MDENVKKYLLELEKKHSLKGLEKGLFRVLIQQELNLATGTTLGTHKALKNFKKRSPIRRAYEEFYKDRTEEVLWKPPQKS